MCVTVVKRGPNVIWVIGVKKIEGLSTLSRRAW